MADFKNLRVWQEAQKLALDAHIISATLRGPGTASLRDQLVRAATSIPINIVEGTAHTSSKEFLRFLGYALASTSEVEGHILLAGSLNLISERDSKRLLSGVETVRKMLYGLIKRVKQRPQ
jgi:four helix bundle protein